MSRTNSLPEEILRQAEALAAREHISVEELVSAALAEQFAGAKYLRRRTSASLLIGFARLSAGFLTLNPKITTDCHCFAR